MAPQPKMQDRYNQEIVQALMKELGLTNRHQVPKLVKVVLNVGLGDASHQAKSLDAGLEELTLIAGQKAVMTRAKKSIAGFKVREGMPIGARVTLRGKRMYDFVSKLVGVSLPRIRDFRGLNEKGFDGHGNYNIGLKDQLVFPEVSYDDIQRLRGMNVTIVTSTMDDQHAKALLVHLGFPFRKPTKTQSSQPTGSQHATAGESAAS